MAKLKRGFRLRKWVIPVFAFIIVVMAFFWLASAYRRALNSPDRTWYYRENVTAQHVESEKGHNLDKLSAELQELTLVLHYEMMQQIMGEDFDSLSNMVRITPDAWRQWYEVGRFEVGSSWYYPDEGSANLADMDAEEVQEITYRHMSGRLHSARNRLSTLASSYGVGYLAIHQDGEIITSGDDELYALVNGKIDYDLIEDLNRLFRQVIVVRYNSNGRWEVPFLLTPETSWIIEEYIAKNYGMIDGLGLTGRILGITSLTYQFDITSIENHFLEWQNPRNMTFVYGIPHDTFYRLAPLSGLSQAREVERPDDGQRYWDAFWDVWSQVTSDLTVAAWLMIVIAIIIPLARVKGADKGYEMIRKIPVEFIVIATFFAWLFVNENLRFVVNHIINSYGRLLLFGGIFNHQNLRIMYFHALLFIALCLFGYVVCYVKDIHASGWESLKDDSFVYRMYVRGWKELEGGSFVRQLYSKFVAVDLKKSQNMRIFILVFGQVAVGFGLLGLSLVLNPWDPMPLLLLFLVPLYLIVVFLYARYKVAQIRKDYMRLFEITQELAAGNTEVSVTDNLGYFETLKDELMTIQNGFGHAVEQALSSERMKGDLITNVSHDLKTPLTSIITYVDLLKVEDLSDEKRQQYLETLELKTERLKTLIEDLFEVSKASSGNLKLDMREVNVVTLMKQTILGLGDRISEAGLILRECYPEESIKMELDGGRMHRVFENLIVNMVKYAMPNTRAYIDIIPIDDSVKIILRNVSAQEINVNAFDLSERFVRGEESRTTEGTGLGLAIAKSFVELQGGEFEIAIDGDLFKVIISFTNK